jgi:hypothetical protein
MNQALLSPDLAPTRRIKCSADCVCARGDICTCKCNGANHKTYDPDLIEPEKPQPRKPKTRRPIRTIQTPTLFTT